MKYNWILDVITDLETFAAANDLQHLAAELSHVKQVAAADIAGKEAQETAPGSAHPSRNRPH